MWLPRSCSISCGSRCLCSSLLICPASLPRGPFHGYSQVLVRCAHMQHAGGSIHHAACPTEAWQAVSKANGHSCSCCLSSSRSCHVALQQPHRHPHVLSCGATSLRILLQCKFRPKWLSHAERAGGCQGVERASGGSRLVEGAGSRALVPRRAVHNAEFARWALSSDGRGQGGREGRAHGACGCEGGGPALGAAWALGCVGRAPEAHRGDQGQRAVVADSTAGAHSPTLLHAASQV